MKERVFSYQVLVGLGFKFSKKRWQSLTATAFIIDMNDLCYKLSSETLSIYHFDHIHRYDLKENATRT